MQRFSDRLDVAAAIESKATASDQHVEFDFAQFDRYAAQALLSTPAMARHARGPGGEVLTLRLATVDRVGRGSRVCVG